VFIWLMQIACYFHSKYRSGISSTYNEIGNFGLSYRLILYELNTFFLRCLYLVLCAQTVFVLIIFRSALRNTVWRRIHLRILQPRQCKSWGYKCQRPSQYYFFFLFCIFSKYCDKVLYASLVLLMSGCFLSSRNFVRLQGKETLHF